MKNYNRQAIFTIAILFASFVLFAMPSAITSVGWPEIRDEFGLRQDSIGLLLIMGTIGHLISGAFNGRLLYHFGPRTLLLIGISIFGLSLYGYWLAPSWAVMVMLGLVGGWAAGTIDATGNTIAAARYNERIMNWLHGFFGVGATFGPLIISVVVLFGSDWRGGAFVFATLLMLLLFVMVAFWRERDDGATASRADNKSQPVTKTDEQSAVSGLETLSQPVVWATILFFFVYGGVEVSIGQWAFTIFTESRGLSAESARFWVSVYWGTFTIGRFVFGFISPWLPTRVWLRACVLLISGSVTLLLFPNNMTLGLLALALAGVTQAPVFATLISAIPRLIGQEHASNGIGYVVGAAGIGLAIFPWIAGILADRFSLEAIPPFILIQSLMLIILFELILRFSSRQ